MRELHSALQQKLVKMGNLALLSRHYRYCLQSLYIYSINICKEFYVIIKPFAWLWPQVDTYVCPLYQWEMSVTIPPTPTYISFSALHHQILNIFNLSIVQPTFLLTFGYGNHVGITVLLRLSDAKTNPLNWHRVCCYE